MESALAAVIREAYLIIWDEVGMCVRYCIEAVDRTLREIMGEATNLFGGKCISFSRDFQQILPVAPRGSRGMIVHMCLKLSLMFSELHILNLTESMRLRALKQDPKADRAALEYPEYFLSAGEEQFEHHKEFNINLTPSVNLVTSSSELIDATFNDISERYLDVEWLTSRAILATTNSRLTTINDEIIERFPGRSQTFLSADSVVCDNPDEQKAMELNYPTELLNSIESGSSLPDHKIKLKKGVVVMLLRKIRQNCGHMNGTRYVVHNMTKNLLFLRAISGICKGNSILLSRMNCIPGKDDFPIPGFRRCQFPVRVCFAMTINKAKASRCQVS